MKTKNIIDTSSPILTRQETARLLKVSLQTLYNWTRDGVLKAYKIGNRHVYYKSDEVLAALRQFKYGEE